MKLVAYSLFPVILLSSFVFPTSYGWRLDEVVYVSTGSKAYAFHPKKNCNHIADCWAEAHVKSCTMKEAIEKFHRQPCGTCAKKEHRLWKENGWLKH